MRKSPEFVAMKVSIDAIYPILLSDQNIINTVKGFVTEYPHFANIESNILEASLRIIRSQRDYV